ncbi:MAG: competence/damage-inducible protein A [Bacteroidota bacterium]
MNPISEIITIGDELLMGHTIDTNSAWIGDRLSKIGLPVRRIISISDEPEEIRSALEDSMKRADLILITGGLGPTNDDRTKKTLAEFFNSRLIINQDILSDIEKLWGKRRVPLIGLDRDQSQVPDNCRVIRNPNGTAPGMWFELNGKIIISMPGVPFEMKGMMEETILPALQDHFKAPEVIYKTVMTAGVGESVLATRIKPWEDCIPEGFSLAYLPSPGIVKLRITGKGSDTKEVKKRMHMLVEMLVRLIPDWVYGYDDETLPEVTGRLLFKNKLTLATAESCTGGTIASLITSVPGSSAWYRGSIVAYSNDIKESLLDVPANTIEIYGAVSQEVVEKMASAARIKIGADYAVAVSGIAGPDGGSAEKPVGTVWIAVSGPKTTTSKLFTMGEHRGRNIMRASLVALNMVRIRVLKDTIG